MKIKYRRWLMYALAVIVALFPVVKLLAGRNGLVPGDWLQFAWFLSVMALFMLARGHRCPHCRRKLSYKKQTHCPRCEELLEA